MSAPFRAWSKLFLVLVALLAGAGQSRGQTRKPQRGAAALPIERGRIVDGVYRNPAFGFSYKIPFGWVDRTAAMGASDSATQAADSAKGQVLLAVFERPPEAPRSTVNSGVVIAAESASSYPGLKTAAEYFAPLEQVTTSKGFTVVNEPYDFPVGGKSLPREDFSKSEDTGDMTMHQTSLVLLQKGYIVSLTFISDSDDDMDELLAGLSFPPPQSSPRTHPGAAKK